MGSMGGEGGRGIVRRKDFDQPPLIYASRNAHGGKKVNSHSNQLRISRGLHVEVEFDKKKKERRTKY